MKRLMLSMLLIGLVLIIALSGCKTTGEEPIEEIDAEIPAETADEPNLQPAEPPVEEETPEPETAAEPEPEPEPESESVSAAESEPAPVVKDDVHLKIIATSDVRGALLPYNVLTGEKESSSLAQVYSYVAEQRRRGFQSVVLLDGGNVLQGSLLLDYWNLLKNDSEHIVATVMNAMGYDAAVPGADDVEIGRETLIRVGSESDFAWLAANAVDAQTGSSVITPYTVFDRDGVTIAVLGLVSSDIEPPEGIVLEDPVASAKKWVSMISGRENPDVIIALVQDEGSDTGVQIAQQVSGLSLVISGERTQTVKSPAGQNITVAGTKPKALSAAVAEIHMQWHRDEQRYRIVSADARTESMSAYEVSEEVMESFGYAFDELEAAVMTKVGYLGETIETDDALFGDSVLVDTIHRIQLDLSGADISFASAPAVGIALLEGPIYVRDVLDEREMFGLDFDGPWLYVLELTGNEIEAYLEHSYGMWFRQMETIGDELLGGRDYYNWDSAAGINYVVNVREPVGERLNVKTTADGEVFELDQTYTVVVRKDRIEGAGSYFTEGLGMSQEEVRSRVQKAVPVDLLKGFMMGEEMLGTIDPVYEENWFASPRIWVQRAMDREIHQLR